MKRPGKWYRNNERDVMKELGLEPTPNSGSGWIIKEDGQSDEIICQLKSTDAGSIKVSLQDLHKLEYNASVAHKIPVFAIQFIRSNEVFLLIRPEDVQELNRGLIGGSRINNNPIKINAPESILDVHDDPPVKPRMIKSNKAVREQFMHDNAGKYMKKEKSAK